jgi:phosphatidylinositol alpha-1,6-mannosyltransferase
MKLLIATQNFGPAIGGIEQYGSALARALVEEGASVTVLAPAHPDAVPHDAAFPCDVVRYGSAFAKELGLAGALLRERSNGYDALLCLQWTSAILPALDGSTRLAIVCHGKEVMPLAQRTPRAAAERLARAQVLRRADHVFAVSAFTAEHALAAGARPERTRVINPGVDAAKYAVAAAQKSALRKQWGAHPTLLTVARLVERKGIDTVLRALPRSRSSIPACATRSPAKARIAAGSKRSPRSSASPAASSGWATCATISSRRCTRARICSRCRAAASRSARTSKASASCCSRRRRRARR